MRMKICFINLGNYGSTGSIVRQLADLAKENGHQTLVVYPQSKNSKAKREDDYVMESHRYQYISGELSTFTGLDSCFAFLATLKLLKKLNKFQPDLIHLHNIHGWYVNIVMLFRYIKKHHIRVIWTLHDCWAFTGHCPHFQENGCEKWKTGCHHCNLLQKYPKSYLDNSAYMYRIKKRLFTGVEDLIVVTPSKWLAHLVEESFLKDYPVIIINNGIDLDVFKRSESDFCQKHDCMNKRLILGVASQWTEKKGLDIFLRLAQDLENEFQIVLVGTNEKIDALLPANVISIHRTNNPQELAEIYSAADVFVNPTREDTFPTVNIEALACGTPVVTFNVCGSPEMLDSNCGIVVEKDDYNALKKAIKEIIVDNKHFSLENCMMKAQKYKALARFKDYINLYADNRK